jgi:hypothetical protein
MLDVSLHDAELIAEIELIADLMVLASELDELDQRTIDDALGLRAAGVPQQRAPQPRVPEPRGPHRLS